MKKSKIVFLVTVLFVSMITVGFAEKQNIEVYYKNIGIIVDDVLKVPDEDMKPLIINGRTYVALRFIGESLGKKVTWDGENQKIYISDTGDIVKEYKEIELHNKSTIKGFIDSVDAGNKRIKFRNFSGTKKLPNCEFTKDGIVFKKSIDYALNGLAKELSCDFYVTDIDYEWPPLYSVFKIYDGNDKILYTSGNLIEGTRPDPIKIDVLNKLSVKLEIESYHKAPENNGKATNISINNLKIITKDY